MKTVPLWGMMIALGATALLGLSGCPSGPVLSVKPAALTLSDTKTTEQLSIANDGGGVLTWVAEAGAPWLLLSDGVDGGGDATVSGSTEKVDIIRVLLYKELLPEDIESPTAMITVRSDGGEKEVAVAVERVRTPVLRIVPDTVDFGERDSEKAVEILNSGDAVLQWRVEAPADTDWLTITPKSGAVSRESADLISLTVNRGRMAPSATPYRASIEVLSNGGDGVIDVSVTVPAFVASPASLDFGILTQPTTRTLSLTTQTEATVPLSVSISDDVEWLSVDATTVSISRARPHELRVTANPDGLDEGDYNVDITVRHAASGRSVTVPVVMEVGAPPQFRMDPEVVDFGETREPATRAVTLINDGDMPLDWRLEKPASATWLSVTPDSGTVETSVELTLAANPILLKPGTASVNLSVFAGGVSRVVRVRLTRPTDPIPDGLQVEPRNLDFGNLTNQLDVIVWNEGPSDIPWRIEEAQLPPWLQVTPVTGTVGGVKTQTLRFTVDRTAAPDEDFFSHDVVIDAIDAEDIPSVTVQVLAQPRRFPTIEIIGEGVDNEGAPFILIDIGEDSEVFTIRNTGNAALHWSVDMAGKPAWIIAVVPAQGELRPGREQQVRITTNRAGLTQSGGTHRFLIRSNDPDEPVSPLDVNVRVPFSIIIGARPSTLNFGRNLSTVPFEVANLGDAGQPLDFVITTNRPDWIFIEPERGRSMGTSGAIKDWRIISVAIDRSRIDGQGAAAKLIVSAENVPPNASPVTPVEIAVAVDVAELTIETAFPRLRAPSLLRFNLLLRDSRQRIFPGLEDNPFDGRTLYRSNTVLADILEDSVPLDLAETNVFVKKDEELRFAVLILLDYSRSMLEAAEALERDGQLNPAGRNPLDALYIETIGAMMDELPEQYKIGLAVFNERRPFWTSDIRVIHGAPLGYPLRVSHQNFVSDKDVLRHRLENMDVQDYGATPLYPAIAEAAMLLYNLDRTLPDFDAVCERFLVAVTDGRRTTPPGDLNLVKELLYAARVRFMSIGFGKDVVANPLIQLSTESGGHFYSTDSRIEIGADGQPVSIPLMGSLLDWCRTNPLEPDAQSLPRDLRSHVTLSYVTLNEETTAAVQGRLTVEEVTPVVTETFTVDQVPMFEYSNDVRMGQIGMRTQGIQADQTATVRVYADYMPRGIKELRFTIATSPPRPWAVQPVIRDAGGLIADWTFSTSGDQVLFSAPTGRALAYGDYGNLFDIELSSLNEPVTVYLDLTAPLITGHPDSKFFTLPDAIDVNYEPFTATSFPNPAFHFTPGFDSELSNIITLGADESVVTLQTTNVGGEHLPTDAALFWRLRAGSDSLPGTMRGAVIFSYWRDGEEALPLDFYLEHDVDYGEIATLSGEDAVPGLYSINFYVDVHYGSLYLNYTHGPYYLVYEVD